MRRGCYSRPERCQKILNERASYLSCAELTDVDLTGSPLSQFQYAKLDKGEMLNVVATINSSLSRPLSDRNLSETFELWWPKLQSAINEMDFSKPEGRAQPKSKASQEDRLAVLEESVNELLHISRRLEFQSKRRAPSNALMRAQRLRDETRRMSAHRESVIANALRVTQRIQRPQKTRRSKPLPSGSAGKKETISIPEDN